MQNKYKQVSKKLMKHSIYGIFIQCLLFASVFASGTNKGESLSTDQFSTTDAPNQEISVTGTVTSFEVGAALPGVNILLKGTSQGTMTDVAGRYTVHVPAA